jgi:cytochrome b561
MSIVPPAKFAWPVRTIHWVSAGLVLLAYLTSELTEEIAEGERAGTDWHVFAGVALLVLFLPRLLSKVFTRTPPVVPPSPAWSVLLSRLVASALLLFVIVQPMLGVCALWSEGHALAIPFTHIALPPPVALGESSGEWLEEAHEIIGNAFYVVIALHVLGALWHHLMRRDNALRRML